MDFTRRALILMACIGVSACAGAPGLDTLIAPAAEPKPFVVETRPAGDARFPAVGVTPQERTDTVLSPEESEAMKADLRRAACRIPGNCPAN